DFLLGHDAMLQEVSLGLCDRIPLARPRHLFFASILHLVVRRRMRFQTNDLGFDESRSAAFTHALNEWRQSLVDVFVPGSVNVIARKPKPGGNAMDFRSG